MKKFRFQILIILLITGFVSCETMDDFEVEYSPAWPVSGEWWVTWEFDDGTGDVSDHYGVGHVRFLTYGDVDNTGDSLWAWDYGEFWDIKVKTGLNVTSRTFSVSEGQNVAYDSKVTLQNGLVIEREDGDSIYMEIGFDDDATPYSTTYIVSGRRVKGFLDGTGSTSYEADYVD